MNRTRKCLWALAGLAAGAMIALLALMLTKGGPTLLYTIGGFSAGVTLGWCLNELQHDEEDDE